LSLDFEPLFWDVDRFLRLAFRELDRLREFDRFRGIVFRLELDRLRELALQLELDRLREIALRVELDRFLGLVFRLELDRLRELALLFCERDCFREFPLLLLELLRCFPLDLDHLLEPLARELLSRFLLDLEHLLGLILQDWLRCSCPVEDERRCFFREDDRRLD